MKWWPLTFQNQTSLLSKNIDWFHDYILILLIFVLTFVGGFLIIFVQNNMVVFAHLGQSLEVVWTIVPAVSLFLVGVPSLEILYANESKISPTLSVKITGHQWYWSYDYLEVENLEYDSFMKPTEEINSKLGEFRNLEVDNRVILPFDTEVLFLVSSSDVLHSWALPSISLKADANPGRLNLVSGLSNMIGVFLGQCSELCGTNHSFMPIEVEFTSPYLFSIWSSL